jgi:hypothetical protein
MDKRVGTHMKTNFNCCVNGLVEEEEGAGGQCWSD